MGEYNKLKRKFPITRVFLLIFSVSVIFVLSSFRRVEAQPTDSTTLRVIPQTNWTLVFVDSQEMAGTNYAATNSFDGDVNTFWHTEWFNSRPFPPHEIQINIGAVYNVSGFLYLPRQDGNPNGRIGQYEFYVSLDGVNWGTAVATGTLANTASKSQVLFTSKTGQYVRLRALTEVNGLPYTSMAELSVLETPSPDSAGVGPLKINPYNPRYFTDANGKSVYLTGSHSSYNLQDSAFVGQFVTPFDYTNYLNFLQSHNHNFMRMWASEGWGASSTVATYNSPMPYKLVSGTYDNNPKYDLTQFDQNYFDRMRQRIILAGNKGIYVSVMLFQGWSTESKGYRGNPWLGHPYNVNNNINGVNGDLNGDGQGIEVHTLQSATITNLQDAYIRKVIDTVGDLDNVLYEVSNEDYASALDTQWQYHVINLIKSYEATKPKQHPVGMTMQWSASTGAGTNADLFNSPADWISPFNDGLSDYTNNPPAASGAKVIILDTDHLGPRPADHTWVWKSFTRGNNPIYLDDDLAVDPLRETFRKSMGDTLTYAAKMNLTSMTPQGSISSTGYALANPGSEYLVYLPLGGSTTLNLSGVAGTFNVEWLDPVSGTVVSGELITGGGINSLTAPFGGDAVLYISKTPEF